MQNKQPRAHAEKIIQWANGATVRFRIPGESKWIYTDDPAWIADYEYEIVEPKVYPETKMDCGDFNKALGIGPANATLCARIANAALRHAIDAGQVVTREEFDRAIGDRKARDLIVAEAMREACFSAVVAAPLDRRASAVQGVSLASVLERVNK